MRSSVGLPSPRSWRVDLVRLRFVVVCFRSVVFWFFDLEISLYAYFCVRDASLAPEKLCSRDVINSTFWGFSRLAPSAASRSASSLPVIPACPLIHSKEVVPALFLSLFAIGLRRFAWVICMKSSSVCLFMFSHRASHRLFFGSVGYCCGISCFSLLLRTDEDGL